MRRRNRADQDWTLANEMNEKAGVSGGDQGGRKGMVVRAGIKVCQEVHYCSCHEVSLSIVDLLPYEATYFTSRLDSIQFNSIHTFVPDNN